jgi:hypothetical protein
MKEKKKIGIRNEWSCFLVIPRPSWNPRVNRKRISLSTQDYFSVVPTIIVLLSLVFFFSTEKN